MKQVNQVGVDVDSEALVCMMKRAGQPLPLATFANTVAGHKKFIRWTTKGGHPARVCLEATGIYSLEFALALHHATNVEVMVVNPRAIKDFARACMQRAKTDAVDAGGILDYLERMPFAAWHPRPRRSWSCRRSTAASTSFTPSSRARRIAAMLRGLPGPVPMR